MDQDIPDTVSFKVLDGKVIWIEDFRILPETYLNMRTAEASRFLANIGWKPKSFTSENNSDDQLETTFVYERFDPEVFKEKVRSLSRMTRI